MNKDIQVLIEREAEESIDFKLGEKYEMEIVGVGKGIVEIVEVDGCLMIYEPTQGYYCTDLAKIRSDLKFKKIEA